MAGKSIELCEFSGCQHKATTIAHKLWGKGGTIRTCDGHRPGSNPAPAGSAIAAIVARRAFYRLEPIIS